MEEYTKECSIMVTGEYISEIYRWYTEKSLFVNRRYQRKLIWTLEEKKEFIITLLNHYPVPLFLLVNSDQTNPDLKTPKKEIIDGLQRLEAIISFILNKYPVSINGIDQYFNLDVYPGNGILLKNKELVQKQPVMDAEVCREFMLYQLPVSTINASDTVVDDVFKRINSTGRKLSQQDLRQTGSTSKFSNLVRLIATHLRGDASDDIVTMNEIQEYSLSNSGLDYGIDVRSVFWVEHGIITEDGIRRSKDEEIIAMLCNCLLNNYTPGMSLSVLDRLYDETSSVYKRNEELLTSNKEKDIINLFRRVIYDLEQIFSVKNTTYEKLFFKSQKCYNKDLVFIVIFLSFSQLYTEHREIGDYSLIADAMEHLADKELSEIIRSSKCEWNTEIRNRLIDRVKNKLMRFMNFRENNPVWNNDFINLMKQKSVENQMIDFKIGLRDLRSGEGNFSVIEKCVKTLTAMANTNPGKEGVVVIGVSDNEADACDFTKHYGVRVLKYNEYFVPGISEEAKRYHGSVQNYLNFIKGSIEKAQTSQSVIHSILTTMDTIQYEGQILVVLKLSTSKPLFYDKSLYVRYDSHNHLVENGSDEFHAVMSRVYGHTR